MNKCRYIVIENGTQSKMIAETQGEVVEVFCGFLQL